jgi:hypothetical protein
VTLLAGFEASFFDALKFAYEVVHVVGHFCEVLRLEVEKYNYNKDQGASQ